MLAKLGFTDRNVIFLLPRYKLKQHKPQTHTSQWSEDATAQLQGVLAYTDCDDRYPLI